jgi:hypothetical protein
MVVVVMTALVVVLAAPAWAASVRPATITEPDSTTPLTSGGSQTSFGLFLPDGARCPGDSASPPYYLEFSYLEPEGTDLSTVGFGGVVPDKGFFLVAYGAPFEQINTEKGTGRVLVASAFDLSRFNVSELLPGGAHEARWEAGIACVDEDHKHVADAWQAPLVITASAADKQGFTWTATSPPAGGGSSEWWLGILAVALIVAAAGVGFGFRPRAGRAARRAGTS